MYEPTVTSVSRRTRTRASRAADTQPTPCARFLPHVDWHQPVPQINYPDINVPYIRIVEWKHMTEPEAIPNIRGTVITTETPYMPLHASGYEYPFPDTVNQQLYHCTDDHASRSSFSALGSHLFSNVKT
jgi:UDP-galactopyranose mutase